MQGTGEGDWIPEAQPVTIALILEITCNLLVKYTEPTTSDKANELCYCQSISAEKTNLKSTGSLLIPSAGYRF